MRSATLAAPAKGAPCTFMISTVNKAHIGSQPMMSCNQNQLREGDGE
ncbi:hypothetical protein [Dyella jiangningensis]